MSIGDRQGRVTRLRIAMKRPVRPGEFKGKKSTPLTGSGLVIPGLDKGDRRRLAELIRAENLWCYWDTIGEIPEPYWRGLINEARLSLPAFALSCAQCGYRWGSGEAQCPLCSGIAGVWNTTYCNPYGPIEESLVNSDEEVKSEHSQQA